MSLHIDESITDTDARATAQDRRDSLRRVLYPSSIAVVGLSDNSNSKGRVAATLASGVDMYFVNPRYDTVLGQKTYASLRDVGRSVDVVVSFMSAERTTELVEDAADLGVGGVVVYASGFAELGEEGQALQQRIRQAADKSGMAVIGPNGLGYVNVPQGISLAMESQHDRRPGGISVVSQSGGMLLGVTMAAWAYDGAGLNLLVSAGNEAVTDLADYVDFLAEDSATSAIGLIIESIRRPKEFFAAVRRAVEAGKPVVALKLARTERTQAMAKSHTGALAGDAWVYDVALKQAGVSLAYDIEELVDRLAIVGQVPSSRWTGAEKMAFLSMTGGTASLTLDVASVEGVGMPAFEDFTPWLEEKLPGVTIANPLDITGQGGPKWPLVVDHYGGSDQVDSLMFINPMAEGSADVASGMLEEFTRAAKANPTKTFVAANCSGVPGTWAREIVGDAVALGSGVRATLRGLETMGSFTRYRNALRAPVEPTPELPRPTVAPIEVPEGLMLPFGATMELLASAGLPVARYHLIPADVAPEAFTPAFAGPYVVKLADVAHRTEYNAVRLKVTSEVLADAVRDLRTLAADNALPAVVVVQPMVDIAGEALLGVQGDSELGPLVAFGLGGIFVEALGRLGGRMAPFEHEDARGLIDEFRDVKVMHGFRGRPAWDHEALADILVATSRLASGGRRWIASLDVNPLVYGSDGFQLVDALLLVRPEGH